MTLSEALQRLDEVEALNEAYNHAMSILYLDGSTAAPRQSWRGRSRTMGRLAGLQYQLMTAPDTLEALQTILQNRDACGQIPFRRAEKLHEDLEEMLLTPAEEYAAYQQLQTEADAVWHEAKAADDYPLFAPYLEKLLAFQRRFAQRKDPHVPAYDVLLGRYEKGLSQAKLDPFFALLRDRLTPLIQAVSQAPAPRTDFLHRFYPAEAQRRFSDRLMAIMGLDRERCAIAETEHPFTDGSNKWDVRITTHYHEDDVSLSMYSVLHEGGHAMYDLNVADELQFTCLGSGSDCMSIHESQSRFYENLIGRSEAFCRMILPEMRVFFPDQLRDVEADELYRAVNMATPSLIRTEADELTYPLHVLVRYEMEKRMIGGDVSVAELPEMWNSLYRQHLGVEVPTNRQGILQDSHWGGGMFGYFPTYALGSAYGVRMLAAMEQEVDVQGAAAAGDLSPVTAWLAQRIHRFGRLQEPGELLRNAGVEPFRPEMYVRYLEEKFARLYGLR